MMPYQDAMSGVLSGPARIEPDGARHIRAGYLPLVDAAVLIVAEELGFAGREGLGLDLVRDLSWANVRDRLAYRQYDVAHMLAPMPVASMLGLGSNPAAVIAPFALGRGGNAVTLSNALHARIRTETGLSADAGALDTARALGMVIRQMAAAGEPAPALGVTYTYSSHNYELRYWLAAGGVDPDRDVRLVVVPPPLTSDALETGAIDGFCVGAPWHAIAARRGVGRMVAAKQDIWPSSPEKVLGVRPEWAERNGETLSRLLVALDAAARWCDDPAHHDDLALLLAQQRHLDTPPDLLRTVLSGHLVLDNTGAERVIPGYLSFHAGFANYPGVSGALWLYSQMRRWQQCLLRDDGEALARAAFRPDLYRAALGSSAVPDSFDGGVKGADPDDAFLDGRLFDPAQIEAYVKSFGHP